MQSKYISLSDLNCPDYCPGVKSNQYKTKIAIDEDPSSLRYARIYIANQCTLHHY